MLPINTVLGEIEIVEIYEYLDGPRLFAAKNNIGTMYLVFWFDEEDDATGWLYLPISEEKLSKLRRKVISLNTAFKSPETNYYLVYTGIPPREDCAEAVDINKIDTGFFPPEEYYIEYADVVAEKTYEWVFEAILNGGKLSAEKVAQFIGRFRETFEDIMDVISGKNSQLYPQSAVPGSFKIKFSADNNGDAIKALEIIQQLTHSDSEEELQDKLVRQKINSYSLKDFLSSIVSNSINVKVIPKFASDGDEIELPIERVKQCIEYLNNINNVTIDSVKIPQANDIDKILQIVKMIDLGIPLIPENIGGIAKRQVEYYTNAAYGFGLVTKDKQLTNAGRFILSRSEKEEQYEILADRFESTDVGWAWMTWANAQHMTDLDPNTAADFLIASVPKLSEDTARRRASTLRKWLNKLKPYHRKYIPE